VLTWGVKSVEVANPWATYELVVKTEMRKGSAVPKGRIIMPREPKQTKQDTVLVFADGRLAEEAKRAGADMVGGVEMVEAVSLLFYAYTRILYCLRSLRADFKLPPFFVRRISSGPSLRD